MKVHKVDKFKIWFDDKRSYDICERTVCGKGGNSLSSEARIWRKVTCKNCLKRKIR